MPGTAQGTWTFFFTDIAGSTRLWEQHAEAMKYAVAAHDAILRDAVESRGGRVFKTVGDSFCAAFQTAPEALAAAMDVLQALLRLAEKTGLRLQVRVAIHTG
ncbi:MAG: adenylate/guanylate cyclase domain-containing protein, partial [Methylocella sp.]